MYRFEQEPPGWPTCSTFSQGSLASHSFTQTLAPVGGGGGGRDVHHVAAARKDFRTRRVSSQQ